MAFQSSNFSRFPQERQKEKLNWIMLNGTVAANSQQRKIIEWVLLQQRCIKLWGEISPPVLFFQLEIHFAPYFEIIKHLEFKGKNNPKLKENNHTQFMPKLLEDQFEHKDKYPQCQGNWSWCEHQVIKMLAFVFSVKTKYAIMLELC